MKTEDELLVDSFLKASVKEVPDAGFTRRVMRHIPNRASRYNRWWKIFCTVVFVSVFTVLNGFEIVWQMLADLARTNPHTIAQPNTLIAIIAILAVGCWQLCHEVRILE